MGRLARRCRCVGSIRATVPDAHGDAALTADDTPSADPSTRSLRRLFKGLERRFGMDGAARTEIEKQLVEVLDELAALEARPPIAAMATTPPRAVAVAMASALYCQPHLGVIFGDVACIGTDEFEAPRPIEPERPLVMNTDALGEALGLQAWELDDIREDIDRRVGIVLKQARALRWLWTHFGLPEASCEGLFRVLFPGAPGRVGQLAMVRRGAQLYALVQQEIPPPVEALYLPWTPVSAERAFHPLRTFGGRYVNNNVRRSIARGIGASDDEVIELLDRMVTIIPRTGTGVWLARDAWRSRGLAMITDLPAPYNEGAWLSSPIEPEDLSFTPFLRVEGDRLVVHDAAIAFDSLAVARVDEMIRQLYGEILARMQLAEPNGPRHTIADLVPMDVERHLRAVLKPLLDWADSPRTAAWVAGNVGMSVPACARALVQVRAEWVAQLEAAWIGAPRDNDPKNAQWLIASHLVVVRDGLHRVLTREPDPRAPHRDVALLFSAFYMGHQPLERLWAEANESVTWPASAKLTNPMAESFWGTWQRVLASWEDESTNP